jgi:hypothetical protein
MTDKESVLDSVTSVAVVSEREKREKKRVRAYEGASRQEKGRPHNNFIPGDQVKVEDNADTAEVVNVEIFICACSIRR